MDSQDTAKRDHRKPFEFEPTIDRHPRLPRAQQAQVLARLRELGAILTTVDHRREAFNTDHSPAYIVGYCTGLVDVALREAEGRAA